MNSSTPNGDVPKGERPFILPAPLKMALSLLTAVGGLGLIVALLAGFILMMAYPSLPDIDALATYQPKMPLRVFSADNVLIGEFGEERRSLVRYKDIPAVMKQAVLAIEDDRFYEHGGVDYWGILRAMVNNTFSGSRQGASTITQQVARNFFLSSEQTIKRKLYEVLLAWKIEKTLTKDQILELYMNQIYLGQRAYGFASAAQIYFGKKLNEVTVAEAAMLAGLPKAPSANNPVVNPKRAKTVNSMDKSAADWSGFKDERNLQETLQQERKKGYLDRQAFLAKVDAVEAEKIRDAKRPRLQD